MNRFTKWYRWENRNIPSSPGIYAIAVSRQNLENTAFVLIENIKYFGMTVAKNGLRGRLKQFHNTLIQDRPEHGGADRFRYQYPVYENIRRKIFVSVRPFICNVSSNQPNDLRIMGRIVKMEFDCLARYVEEFENLPQFNDKANSLKYSHNN